MKKVSVIIPVYNTPEKYLKPCLDSVLTQTLEEIEIIIVDNCSDAETFQKLEGYAKADSRILLIRQAVNGGVANSRNTGASHATGDFLYFMDSDDILSAHGLAYLWEKSIRETLDVLLFRGAYCYEGGGEKPLFSYPDMGTRKGKDVFLTLKAQGWKDGYVWTQFLRHSSFQERKLSFFTDVDSCDDQLFTFQNLMTAQRVACDNEIFYHYQVRENSGATKEITKDYVQGAMQWYFHTLAQCQNYDFTQKEIPVLKEYLQQIRICAVYHHWLFTTENPLFTMETLENVAGLLFGEPLRERDKKWQLDHWDPENSFCFFGAGLEGKRILSLFRKKGYPTPVAICDNNKALEGHCFEEIPIVSWESFRKENLFVFITNQRYEKEIREQVSAHIPAHRVFSLTSFS